MNKITNNDEETFGETLNTVILGIVKLLRFPILTVIYLICFITKPIMWFHKKLPW